MTRLPHARAGRSGVLLLTRRRLAALRWVFTAAAVFDVAGCLAYCRWRLALVAAVVAPVGWLLLGVAMADSERLQALLDERRGER